MTSHKASDALAGQWVDVEADNVLPAPSKFSSPAARLLFAISLVLIALNLRPIFSSLSVVLPEVIADTSLSTVGASLLTTLPVLCLGLFAPFAPGLAQRFGAERILMAALALVAFGTALRGIDSIALLFFGTFAAGAAIAVANVLLPGVVKHDFPEKTAIMTGFYTMAISGGSAMAAGLTLPVSHVLGSWSAALAAWAIPALLVLFLFAPQALRIKPQATRSGFKVKGLWRDRLAWQVTIFMGLQSALAYCVFGWLAPILRERGFEPTIAGGIVSLSVMVQVITCLGVPSLAIRCKNQRGVNVILMVFATVGLLGMMFAPVWSVLFWAIMQGIGQGGLIAAAMIVIVLRSPDPHIAAHLSGMAQGVGYTLAATGPLLLGLIRSWTGSFDAAALLIIALGLIGGLAGAGAGRNLHVHVHIVKSQGREKLKQSAS
ncbi:CynX/NimT family MFS transporter [Aquamicrobium segne]|uniref:CynX/NimT family MFS transporter n=1 Tax=Aquamicrobium segne TaxID=469547 RepID=A0ABW0GZ97_9HYPH